MIILGFSFIFIFVLTFLIILFIIRYRQEKHPKAVQIEGNVRLEIAWFIGAVALVLVLFYFGWAGWKPMKNPPEDAMEIRAVARMWQFQFVYGNGKVTDTLYVPVNKAVKLDLVALDVIHSLYIPAFRLKEDMVPGVPKNMWFIAQKPGEYDLFCAEYCGLQHSYMLTGVNVLTLEAFDKWYSETVPVTAAAELPAWKVGFQLLRKNGCNACHSSDGSRLIGPSYLGIYGNLRTVTTGKETRQVTADDEYIRRSVYEPDADVVEGFNKGMMISYKELISEEELQLIIEYFRTLK
jgi:cytochrome c oxidase subunit 2